MIYGLDKQTQYEIAAWQREARRYDLLTAAEEIALFAAWRDRQDLAARNRILNAHKRIVVSMAVGHLGYGLPLADMISEGVIGLIRAIDNFDPAVGVRFGLYAKWWVRDSLSQYVMRNASIVRSGRSASQKRLFFGLRRTKRELGIDGYLDRLQAETVAAKLRVSVQDAIDMDQRLMASDASLNARFGSGDDSEEFLALQPDESPAAEEMLVAEQTERTGHRAIAEALGRLNDRERAIFVARRFAEEPTTLRELGAAFGLSNERVRQIEAAAFKKIADYVRRMLPERGMLPTDLLPAA